ncbi:MAG: hypothetical protein AAF699_21565 [Pseudomonadota bacterium]
MKIPYFLSRQAHLARRYNNFSGSDRWEPVVVLKSNFYYVAKAPTQRDQDWLLANGNVVKTEDILSVEIGRHCAGYD